MKKIGEHLTVQIRGLNLFVHDTESNDIVCITPLEWLALLKFMAQAQTPRDVAEVLAQKMRMP